MRRVVFRSWVCGLVWWGWSALAHAQTPQVVEVQWQLLPPVTLDQRANAGLRIETFDAAVNVPIPVFERAYLMPGIHYHADALDFSRVPSEWSTDPTYHALEIPLQLVQLLAPGWRLQARVVPELAGDFRAVDGRMFRLSGHALVDYHFSKRLVLGAGAGASYVFGTLLPVPVVYVTALPHERVVIEGFLPAFANIKFLLNPVLEIGLRGELAGHHYSVRDAGNAPCTARTDDPSTPRDDSLAQADQCFDNIAYSVASVGVQAALQAFGAFWLTAYFGRTLYRRFEQRTRSGDRIPEGLADLPNAFQLRFTVSLRLGPNL